MYIYKDHGELVFESCDNFEACAFISGSLENLGWAVFRGVEFVNADKAIDVLCHSPQSWWGEIKKDADRKMLETTIHHSKRKKKDLEPFVAVKDELFKLCTDHVLKVKNYMSTSWNILINDGQSDGQGAHTDFPMVHNNDSFTHSSTRTSGRCRIKRARH